MVLWNNTDANTSAPKWIASQYNLAPTSNNANLLFGNTTQDIIVTNAIVGLFGVDTNEQQAANTAAPTHAGWVVRTVGTGGRAGRITYETLVAMGSMTEDAEDTIFADYRIVVNVQPEDSEESSGNAVNFIVEAASVPAGATLTYFWQVNAGAGWANVANTGVYASANGNTTPTLSISNNALLADNVYRVRISLAGANTVFSANATLTLL